MITNQDELEDFRKALEARRLLNERYKVFPYEIDTPEALAFEIAMQCIILGSRCPSWASKLVQQGWERYTSLDCNTLGEAFGLLDHKRRGAKKTDANARMMHIDVMLLRELGHPVKDSSNGDGAYSIVGRKFNVSPQTVEKAVAEYRLQLKAIGLNADAAWKEVLEPTTRTALGATRRPKKKSNV